MNNSLYLLLFFFLGLSPSQAQDEVYNSPEQIVDKYRFAEGGGLSVSILSSNSAQIKKSGHGEILDLSTVLPREYAVALGVVPSPVEGNCIGVACNIIKGGLAENYLDPRFLSDVLGKFSELEVGQEVKFGDLVLIERTMRTQYNSGGASEKLLFLHGMVYLHDRAIINKVGANNAEPIVFDTIDAIVRTYADYWNAQNRKHAWRQNSVGLRVYRFKGMTDCARSLLPGFNSLVPDF